jgi:hypothetical protein
LLEKRTHAGLTHLVTLCEHFPHNIAFRAEKKGIDVLMKFLSCMLTAIAVVGCGGNTTTTTDSGVSDAANLCVPDRAAWMSTVRAQVQRQCGSCHGDVPQFGAPYSLLDYDTNIMGRASLRRVDRMVARLLDASMPPSGTPAPTDDVAQSIVNWASCGTSMARPGMGLRSSAPQFRSPDRSLGALPSFEILADNFAITRAVTERYQCYGLDVPVTEARFARRFEIVLDRTEVVHHVVLLRDTMRTSPSRPFECGSMPEGSQFLYAWAPGQNSLQFPDGGLRMMPGERYVLQVHYNNSAGREGFTDRSGVRIFHDAPGGTEYGMVAMGPLTFSIPARSTGMAESACTVSQGSRMLAGMPHMHGIGTAFSQYVLRADGTREPVIDLQGWSFDSQLFYSLPVTFGAGDRIVTRCDFNNTRSTPTRQGSNTTDEMCFNFAYVTPPPSVRFCDEAITPAMPSAMYRPGMCAPPAATTDLPLITGTLVVSPAPAHTGGTIPSGRWELDRVTYHLSTAMTGAGSIDLTQSTIPARGQIWTESNRIVADINATLALVLENGPRFSRETPISFAATFTTATTPLALTGTCPTTGSGAPRSLDYTVTGDSLVMSPPSTTTSGVTITPRYTFRRIP